MTTESVMPVHPRQWWIRMHVVLLVFGGILAILIGIWAFAAQDELLDAQLPQLGSIESKSDESDEWNLIAWDKQLWPKEAVTAPKKGPAPKPPKAELIAIVQQGNAVKAAIDFGQGMQYLSRGDEHKGVAVQEILESKVKLSFKGRSYFLELP